MKSADETAIAILGWLANEPELLSRFLALTGTDPVSLRKAVGDPAFMGGVVAFLMDHEPTLIAFCAATGTAPEDVVWAHQAFSGPAHFED
ncbi:MULTISPECIES: DUF3572 domain-containing protein [Sinorhizobium]|uniref:DUF3572 family protein n=2 Tax=Sinorhizobium TaxID=28105 RepID=A0A2S3YGL8_9HYPH|nr:MULTISPECIES: DUF3572 domain-containing protein [Sinorhizobium]ASY55999.1 hypothetical protein SS05631_c10490 [Sinorhizobium sp. CCBAU 05631]AUX75933.1 hypothetical protein NXT3_CH01346 [Sinorhizobium fredii]PDT40286.1 DUF3572 domain-containing protein [Sinorhizobium sp. FG01]PDT52603.1 DUF3572 domain-containing protein [Sinorhizobium sp. NG07B]POH25520.1 hypothetical protein ATY31_25995 [Sinorhizobium americanum]